MTRRSRNFLFLGFFLLFCFLAVVLVFYSSGWRAIFVNCGNLNDFKSCRLKFQKTGGIYIETDPKGAGIYLDGKNIPDQSGFLKSGTLISDLLPKFYKIKITKDGYFDYFKSVKVESTLVSEIVSTVLIPKNIADQKIFQKIKSLEEILDIDGSGRLLLKTLRGNILIYDPFNFSSTPINLGKFNKVRFHPFRDGQFIIENNNGLYIADVYPVGEQSTFTKIIANGGFKDGFWENYGPNIYFLNKDYLQTYNLITDSTSTLSTTTLAGDFKVSGDGKKLAFANGGELKIYFLSDWYQNFKARAGDVISFNLGTEIKKVFWYKDSLHLIVLFKNSDVKFVEIDNRPPQNIFPLLSGVDDIFYSGGKLYFIQDGEIFYFSAL